MSFIYLASPYTDPDYLVMQERYELALKAVSKLIEEQVWAYSPIVHNHHIAMTNNFSTGFEFWEAYDFAMLGASNCFTILCLPGWDVSVGVLSERAEAIRLGLPLEYIDP